MKRTVFVLTLVFSLISAVRVCAQEPYKLPPKEIIDILDAPRPPIASISPTSELMLLVEYEPMPSIAYLAQPLLRLAGIRITPKNNSRRKTIFYTGLVIKRFEDGKARRISLPEGAKLGFPQWSFDGRWVAFLRYTDKGVELWAAETESGRAKPLTAPNINAVLTSGFRWMPDNRHLIVNAVLEDRGPPPESPSSPVGPNIQETAGKFSKVRTYQDLLEDSYDEDLFDYYATSQIVVVDVISGQARKIGAPGIYMDLSPSPDGNLLLVEKIKKPYSHSVPYYYFPFSIEIWNNEGELVHLLADMPLTDEVPIRGVPTGPRSLRWRPLRPATLIWVEALDDGDPEREVPHRDKLMTLSAPFKENPEEVRRIEHRFSRISWLEEEGRAFIAEYDWKKRWRTTYLINVDKPEIREKKIFDLSVHDRYNDPGHPIVKTTESGEHILLQDGDWIYLSGGGASPKGDRPFLDRMNTKTLEKERLFQSGAKSYEVFYDFVGDSRNKIVTSHESKTDPPNFYSVDLESKKRQALTDFKDPTPQLKGVKKQLIKHTREDGVKLSGTLYLPPEYKKGRRLPVVIWAYPLEYSDPDVAGQVRGSPHRFTFFRGTSRLFLLTQGYAVLDRAQMPIVGDPKTMNDTFVEQVVASAKAAIEKLDAMGIVDPKRVGVGGHSYGAFMTVNLLAHSDLFAAGIAKSGAYNRTLTPFGFQSERRTLWEAPEAYFKVSPFMHADKINEPLLLIHGEIDSNSGTYPLQSQRLFHALKGHGATARLVMLPYEGHGYRARESVLHVLAEMIEWIDKYVKNKK
ncbi:S9 family peptidase [candidate division TA06 bacterium]|uniref:S9 family peptidase n=1 Tax=candidate division TA06 bacterium TaxID=2250710 RepID=A0A523XE24_UNCT6|nr:MAG: S9 family peptidase [candidate division TA06 bacterium]